MQSRSRYRKSLRLAALLVPVALIFTGCDWTMFMYGPARTGDNPGETTIGLNNVAQLQPSWNASIGDASGGTWGSGWSPSVANGVAYVPFGPSYARLGAYNATTGVTEWVAQLGGSPTSAPAVANGVLYVPSADGKLNALNAATGSSLWTASLGGSEGSSPAVTNGVVYLGSNSGVLYAFDAAGSTNCSGAPKTCAPLWSASAGGSAQSPPAVANGVVYSGSSDGDLYAFDASGSNGCSGTPTICSPLWTAATGAAIQSSPAISNGVVYVGSDRYYAFDATGTTDCSGTPKQCSPLWTADLSDLGLWSPAVANGVLYVNSSSGLTAGLYALDATGNTGCAGTPKVCTPLWSTATGGGGTGAVIGSSPTVADGLVFDGGSAFDASGATGCSGTPTICSPMWTATNGANSTPAIANGIVYMGAQLIDMADNALTLYAYALPPTTAVIIPSTGAAAQSGTSALLDASASAGVTSVNFELNGGTLSDKVIGKGAATIYGWIGQWNTTDIPNGTYALQSVASYSSGVSGTSSPTTITVAN
jgi:outer membrane protein assembly factor BamB